MQANYMKPLAIKDYARMCGRSISSFRRDFVKTYHTPPGKWLLEKRLEHSRFLLDTTTDRISEILYSAGFNNRAHFNKAFKNAYGMAPNNYRQQPVNALTFTAPSLDFWAKKTLPHILQLYFRKL